MTLSKDSLNRISPNLVSVPPVKLFELPERVLQFGTGVLLRALVDDIIDRANRRNIFNGRVVLVKSTNSGDTNAFDRQDNLFTLCIRGVDNGRPVAENNVNAAISRVLSAREEWKSVLACAHQPQLNIIVSNTTEVGIQLKRETIFQNPPDSYPAKLLAYLYERYMAFKGSMESGLIIIPTELLPDNGSLLKSIVIELAKFNQLSESFLQWIDEANHFCNSLVDRIVPGKPNAEQKKEIEEQLGYKDELLIVAEHYHLWAIEGNESIKKVLSFEQGDEGVKVEPDIRIYRELKLRLLNATHTLCCGPAFLSGFETVKDSMNAKWWETIVSEIMFSEISPAIPFDIDSNMKREFGLKVIDRFRNEAIHHPWINITLQYSSKLRMRVVPILKRYYELFQKPPLCISAGFAAWFLFMRSRKNNDGLYIGEYEGKQYRIQDEAAPVLSDFWQKQDAEDRIGEILSNTGLWGDRLDLLPGFTTAIEEKLKQMLDIGVEKTFRQLRQIKSNS
jgi:tagaturonate reductase